MTTTPRTDLAQELHDEGLPNPWRKASSPAVPNPWAGIVNEPGDPKTIPIVKIDSDGKAWANSRDVAAYFGKRHDHVLRDIGALISQAPACAPNFGPTSETVAMPRGGTRQERAYLMDRDGFTLLAMGFTGSKALQFKMAYIAAYNTLEARALDDLKRQVQIQRMADAIGMAKAMGLIQPGQKGRLEDIVRPFLGDFPST